MSERSEKYQEKYRESVQPHVTDEPVIAVGAFSRPGSMAAMGVGKISPLAGMVMGQKAKKKTGGLPQNILFAITPTKVRIFAYRPKGFGVKVKDELVVWDRAALTVTTEDKATATRVKINTGEEELEFDATMGGGFNEPVVRLLMDPTAS